MINHMNRIRVKGLICPLLALLLLSTCRFPESNGRSIKIVNNSNDTIAYFADERTYDPDYPTMFDELPERFFHIVPIGPKDFFYDEIFFPVEYFNNYPDKKSKIYLFSMDTLNAYSYKEIREGYKYLKRYDLSYADMDRINWTITYP